MNSRKVRRKIYLKCLGNYRNQDKRKTKYHHSPQEDCVKFIFCTYELRPFDSLSCTKFVKLLMS